MKAIGPGHPAPDFSLQRHDGGIFTLSEALKSAPVILVFYPLDGSPNCSRLLHQLGSSDDLKLAGYQVVGINHSDGNLHGQFSRRKQIDMPLLSDHNFQVSASFGSLYSIGPINVIRYTVVGIGRDGIITFYRHGRPDSEQILAALQSA